MNKCYICNKRATKKLFGHDLCKAHETEVCAKRNAVLSVMKNISHETLSVSYIIEYMRKMELARLLRKKK